MRTHPASPIDLVLSELWQQPSHQKESRECITTCVVVYAAVRVSAAPHRPTRAAGHLGDQWSGSQQSKRASGRADGRATAVSCGGSAALVDHPQAVSAASPRGEF